MRPRFLPSPFESLCLAVGLALVWKVYFLYDDAFVYFRYVDNLLFLELGLVYNEGEYVEGYSSPLWTLLLIALRSLELPWTAIVRTGALASYAAAGLLAVALNRRLAPRGAPVSFPLAYLTFTYGAACWFSSGLETPLLHVAAVAYALFALRPGSLPLQLGVALMPLVRHELAVPLVVAVGWSWLSRRRFPWLLLGASAALGGAWLAFRVVYYADLLPNTFYLKDGTDFGQGWLYLADTFGTYGTGWVLAAFTALALLLSRRGASLRIAPRAVMLLAAAAVALYVVRIGGAPIHYRYLAFPFFLAVCATAGVAEEALERWTPRSRRWLAPALGAAAALLAVTRYPRQLDRHPLLEVPEVAYVDGIYEASYHRQRIGTDGRWRRRANVQSLRQHRADHADDLYTAVSTDGWCARAYRKFDERIVHSYGLTDAFLAHVEAPSWRPGHKLLEPLAEDLARVQRATPDPGPGMHRRAVAAGAAPAWIAAGLESIEVLERKVYNRHRLIENLRLALTFPPRISAPLRRARKVGDGEAR